MKNADIAQLLELPLEELIKTFLRIDESEDDGVLALLIVAAKGYLDDAGVVEKESLSDDADPAEKKRIEQYIAKYKLAVMLLVALNYENRNPGMKIDKLSFSLESIILQLKTG